MDCPSFQQHIALLLPILIPVQIESPVVTIRFDLAALKLFWKQVGYFLIVYWNAIRYANALT
jgi:hypothetical protein